MSEPLEVGSAAPTEAIPTEAIGRRVVGPAETLETDHFAPLSAPMPSRSGPMSSTVDSVVLTWAAVSDTGRTRTTNEDGALTGPGLYLLADGMGGHDCGEIASAAALEALADLEPNDDSQRTMHDIIERLRHAQQVIEEIDSDSARRAGTTLTGAVVTERGGQPQWLIVNIGDSRTYQFHEDVLTQLTIDHSHVQELVDAGYISEAEARSDPRRNVITRALGAGMEPEADFWLRKIEPGERLLICSDGLTGELTDTDIADILRRGQPVDVTVDALLAAALDSGGRDNVTIIVVDVRWASHDAVTERMAL